MHIMTEIKTFKYLNYIVIFMVINSKRKSISVSTLEKVKQFLKAQDKPVFKTDIVKGAKVDFNSLKIALGMLNVRTNKDGRVRLR